MENQLLISGSCISYLSLLIWCILILIFSLFLIKYIFAYIYKRQAEKYKDKELERKIAWENFLEEKRNKSEESEQDWEIKKRNIENEQKILDTIIGKGISEEIKDLKEKYDAIKTEFDKNKEEFPKLGVVIDINNK